MTTAEMKKRIKKYVDRSDKHILYILYAIIKAEKKYQKRKQKP